MGEEQFNKIVACIPLIGQIYLTLQLKRTKDANDQLKREKNSITTEKESLEQELTSIKPKLDSLEQLRKRLETKEKDYASLKALFEKSTNDFYKEHEKKEQIKKRFCELVAKARTYKHGPASILDTILPQTIERFGYGLLLLDENGLITFAATKAAEKLGKSKKELVNKNFNDIFDCKSLEWLLDIGPQYPLIVKDTSKEVSAIIAEIPAGFPENGEDRMHMLYAISLKQEESPGLIGRYRAHRLAAPRLIQREYRQTVASTLGATTMQVASGKNVYIDLSNTEEIAHEFIAWLKEIGTERKEKKDAGIKGEIYLCYPTAQVYRQLLERGFPAKNILPPQNAKKPRLHFFGNPGSEPALNYYSA